MVQFCLATPRAEISHRAEVANTNNDVRQLCFTEFGVWNLGIQCVEVVAVADNLGLALLQEALL